MKMKLEWRSVFLILTVLSSCSGIQVSIEKEDYEVARDGDITLTCMFVPARPEFNTLILTWEAQPDNPEEPMKTVATYFTNNPIDIAPAYEGRAFMEVDLDGRVSTLKLTKVTMQDSRQFQCSVRIPNDDEGKPAATTSLLVLVPPSPPICQVQGTAEYGYNISLTCVSKEGSPQPSYGWKSYSVQNIPRPFPPKTTEKDGALSLFNISKEMSGFYICESTNRIGSASCNLTLSVLPGSMNIGSTAVIIGGVLAGVVVLGIVIFCCCRKKGKNDENAEGPPEDVAYYDKDAPETEEFVDDKTNTKSKQQYKDEEKDVVPKSNYSLGVAGQKLEDDQHSNYSGKRKNDGKDNDVDSRRYQDDPRDQYRGSRDRLDDQRDRYRGSHDRLDDRDHYRGSRDRLDDRDHNRGSRDRLDDRDHYRGSRDRLDDRDNYRGSRDRLDDQRDHYRGSRDRLDDQRDRIGGSRDHLQYIDDGY
ncbi:V-set and immunoglobulin domain-containing protein 1 [Xyrichtys novacula]|nr:V-set and immunoglobulin domain-containing protein 1 [Xyrichtys novacula]